MRVKTMSVPCAVLGLLAPMTARAQPQTPDQSSPDPQPPGLWQRLDELESPRRLTDRLKLIDHVVFTLRGGATYGFAGDLDDATGDVSVARLTTGLAVSAPVGQLGWLSVGIDSEFSSYDFGTTDLLPGGADPLDQTAQLDFGALLNTPLDDDWLLTVGLTGGFASTDDAGFSDAFSGGAGATVSNQITENLRLGAGLLVRSQLEDDVLIVPIVLVDWQLNDRLSLATRGSGRGAGGELVYTLSRDWSLTLDAAWERRDYRLDGSHPVSGGVARDTRVPVALGVTFHKGRALIVRLRGGVDLFQQLELDTSTGSEFVSTDIDPAGFISLDASFSF